MCHLMLAVPYHTVTQHIVLIQSDSTGRRSNSTRLWKPENAILTSTEASVREGRRMPSSNMNCLLLHLCRFSLTNHSVFNNTTVSAAVPVVGPAASEAATVTPQT